MATFRDDPIDDGKLLGLGERIETLCRFVTSNNLGSHY